MKLLKFTKRWRVKGESKQIILLFLAWRVWITLFALLGVIFLPVRSPHLFGGGLANYLENPLFWGWANFDGEHYLAIAQQGYKPLTYFFFPAYPLLVRLVGGVFGGSLFSLNLAGLLISHVSLLVALLGLWKLVRLDFKQDIARLTIVLLLVFPTSFYFGSVYTESLFLALVVWSFYFARQKRWWLAGSLGGLASATRFIGVLLLPALFVEWWRGKRKIDYRDIKKWLDLLLLPLGLLAYMYYLWQTTGSPLTFWSSLPVFGEQRSAIPILLPQVFFRYAKIILTATWNDPLYYAITLELVVAILFLVFSVWSFFKLRLPYALFLTLGYLAPTFSGSFSSLPRYVLVLFPGFILASLWLSKKPGWFSKVLLAVLTLLLGITSALFVRGYWIA